MLDLVYSIADDGDWIPTTPDEPRLDIRAARAARASLPPRDQGLTDVIELLYRDPPELVAAAKAASDLTARFPNDAEVAFVDMVTERDLFHKPQTLDLAKRCAALDPKGTLGLLAAMIDQGDPFFGLDFPDMASARADGDACLLRDPGSVACRSQLLVMDAFEGRCAAVEKGGRALVASDPDDEHGYLFRAVGLAGQDGSVPAIRDLLAKSVAHTPVARSSTALAFDVQLLVYGGELERARDAATKAKTDDREEERDYWTSTEIFMAFETGDARGAANLAMKAIAVVDAHPKVINVADEWDYGIWLRAAYEGGAISRASFRERRRAWMDAVRARVEAESWPRNNRVIYFATCSREVSNIDHEEAVEVFDDLGDFDLVHAKNARVSPTLGAILLATGRVDDALVQLESAANACTIDVIYQMRPAFDLGRARAMKGDRAGACQAFAKVLQRWGHAKPRSVTAEKARAEAAKLGCDPVP